MLKQSLIAKTEGFASKEQMVVGTGYRVTILAEGMVRVETDDKNIFTDLPSTSFWFRKQNILPLKVTENGDVIKIYTTKIIAEFNYKDSRLISVHFISENKTVVDFDKNNLYGTCRTLDHTKGAVALEKGLLSKDGVCVIDDSKTFLINKSGEFEKRKSKGKDLYIFAYLNEPKKCLKDYFKVSGAVPLIPRFALGVWWSRYRQYTQQEYIDLIDRFEYENVPLTVATVDMDWHWTDLNKQFGTSYDRRTDVENTVTGGWTGYSWNTDYFPDYKEFLRYLKSKNLHITLNLHPADGVRFFENQYSEMARSLNIDPETKADIPFKVGDSNFWNSYFDVLHKPYEKEGVDFWWIDWQQGKKSDVKGLDPLIPLNHYHFLDNGEDTRMPLILSRYSGLGSHRYPLGFSGDTDISWKVLDFQPYFTATSSNSGYTWWSHDIGGHHQGVRDEELYMRWLQFGVFSPILRLHSTSDDLLGKEPWKYSDSVCDLSKKWLRLRHKLIPFIYSANYETHYSGVPICQPMYYDYPNLKEAYDVKNQYIFGSKLIVAPITKPNDKSLLMGSVKVWLPSGNWTDIFTGKTYNGNRFVTMHRDLSSIPVLACEGAIIPMYDEITNSVENPLNLNILAFNGSMCYDMYEDDGTINYNKNFALTKYEISEKSNCVSFTINRCSGNLKVVPKKRNYKVEFRNVSKGDVYVNINGNLSDNITVDCHNYITVTVNNVSPKDLVKINIVDFVAYSGLNVADEIVKIMSRWQSKNLLKSAIYKQMKNVQSKIKLLEIIENENRLPSQVKSALLDVLCD